MTDSARGERWAKRLAFAPAVRGLHAVGAAGRRAREGLETALRCRPPALVRLRLRHVWQ